MELKTKPIIFTTDNNLRIKIIPPSALIIIIVKMPQPQLLTLSTPTPRPVLKHLNQSGFSASDIILFPRYSCP